MKKPVVLHITPSLMIGGAEKLLVDLLTTFQDHPHNPFEHQVIYFQPGPHLLKLQKLGLTTYHITGLVSHSDPTCLISLYKTIQTIQPTYLHAMLWSANFYTRIIGKILGIPTICSIHSNHNSGSIAQDNLLKSILDQLSLNWANRVVVVSQQIAQKFALPKYRLAATKIITIHNGISLPPMPKCNTNPQFTIGHIGRFVPVKNQILLIQALALVKKTLPNFKAIIIGYGKLEQLLKQLVHQLALTENVTFVASHEPTAYYALFDCFVLPSHQEGQSIALLQAMSFGIAPIVTTSTPSHEIVQHLQNGLICPANQATALANAMITLATNPKLKHQLALQAYTTIQANFNLSQTAAAYLALYQSS